jgi:hypothetical protein
VELSAIKRVSACPSSLGKRWGCSRGWHAYHGLKKYVNTAALHFPPPAITWRCIGNRVLGKQAGFSAQSLRRHTSGDGYACRESVPAGTGHTKLTSVDGSDQATIFDRTRDVLEAFSKPVPVITTVHQIQKKESHNIEKQTHAIFSDNFGVAG